MLMVPRLMAETSSGPSFLRPIMAVTTAWWREAGDSTRRPAMSIDHRATPHGPPKRTLGIEGGGGFADRSMRQIENRERVSIPQKRNRSIVPPRSPASFPPAPGHDAPYP